MSLWPGIISQGRTPDAPTFSVSSRTATSITWKIDNYTSDIDGYSDFAGTGTLGSVQINSGVATVVQSGLSAATSYTISARAFRRLFYSPTGTSSAQFTLPLAPSFTLSSQTVDSITWTISSNYDSGATYTFVGTGTFSQTGSTVVQSGLSGGTGYTIAGSATKNGLNSGNGPTSATAYTVPVAPAFEFVSRTNNSITWKISDATYYGSGSYSITGSGTISRTGQNISQTGLAAETLYSISGTATLNSLTSASASSASVYTAPNAPTFSVLSTSTTRTSITLRISSYSTNYTYRATATAGSVPSISSQDFTITGLSPSQTISITLYRTRNSVESAGTTQNATTQAPATFNMTYLVIGGGGAGNTSSNQTGWGGGGGSGGYYVGSSIPIQTNLSYPISIGAGGNQSNGSDSNLAGSIAYGGGEGGGSSPNPRGSPLYGAVGGSGGGGWVGDAGSADGGESQYFEYGNPGGSGRTEPSVPARYAGGGGGAGGAGSPYSYGGAGRSGSLLGFPGTRASGGSGASTQGPIAAPPGGGGPGGSPFSAGTSATENTGGGGGGSYTGYPAGRGGSGVVMLNVPALYPATFTPGLTRNPSTATTGIISITAGTGSVTFN